jgi:superfamily II DNA or RNA helicase
MILMKLEDGVAGFLSEFLEELSYHPLVYPYLYASAEDPPQHYLHQCEVLARLALRNPVRVLIGDEIGLGKTITALAVSRYMEGMGRISKALIIVPRVLIPQWRKELNRMGITKVNQIERENLESLKAQGFPDGYYLTSIDFIKREERIEEVLNIPWDVIVIDEVHKLGMKTKRFKEVGRQLIERKPGRNVIFLSATPHRGDPRDYISRLQLLDPYLVKGWKSLDRRQFYELTHGALIFRRTKEEINNIYEGKEIFPKAKFYAIVIEAREDEIEFINRLVSFLRTKLIEFTYEKGILSEKALPLLIVLIFKRASSSPYAAIRTLERLIARRAAPLFTEDLRDLIHSVETLLGTGYEDQEYTERDPEKILEKFLDVTSALMSDRDREEMKELVKMAEDIMKRGDSKLNALMSLLDGIKEEKGSKVIIFTEYKDTLEYVRRKLLDEGWPENSILKLSSDETVDERKFTDIRRSFERDPKAKVLIATDVAAEGLNLQVAHILINYEIPWSLIKLEQRIGRVWRLGQKKEVEAYTLFMTNRADKAALRSIYEKLLNLKKADLYPRPITGQEVILYTEAEDFTKLPPYVVLKEEKGKKKLLKITEAKSILTYLKDDEKGLNNLIESIIAAKQEIEKDLRSKGVLYRQKTREEVMNAVAQLGFESPSVLMNSMKSLLKSASSYLGLRIQEEGDELKVIKGFEMPTTITNLRDIYGVLLGEKRRIPPVDLVAYGPNGKVIIELVEIKDRNRGDLLYKEPIGIDLKNSEILRGSKLVDLVSSALSNLIGITEMSRTEVPISLKAKIINEFKKSYNDLLEPLVHYSRRLSEDGLRDSDNWTKSGDIEILVSKHLGSIQFVEPPRGAVSIPEDLKKEIERKALEIVMEVERAEGKIPERVSEEEHYDIKSVDPLTREVRIIEVKGHLGPEVYGELTPYEAELAEKERERYWLYIVYNIGSKPEWVRFRDPVSTMNWEAFEKVEKRYILRPREGIP